MKDIGSFFILLGLIYGAHLLTGTQPNINSWWFQIAIGATLCTIAELRERKARKQREAAKLKRMNEILERQQRWEKGR